MYFQNFQNTACTSSEVRGTLCRVWDCIHAEPINVLNILKPGSCKLLCMNGSVLRSMNVVLYGTTVGI